MARLKQNLPPWDPRPGAETRFFVDWSISKFYETQREEKSSAPLEQPPEDAPLDPEVAQFASLWAHPKWDVIFALVANDKRAFVRLMKEPAKAAVAYGMLQEGPQGKPKQRPGRRAKPNFCPAGVEICIEIERIWKRHFRKWQRQKAPSVYVIASKILAKEGIALDADDIKEHRRKYGRPRVRFKVLAL